MESQYLAEIPGVPKVPKQQKTKAEYCLKLEGLLARTGCELIRDCEPSEVTRRVNFGVALLQKCFEIRSTD